MALSLIHFPHRPYFHGWYFKQQNEEDTIALIPGFQEDGNGNRSAFIQVIFNEDSHFFSYPMDTFYAEGNQLSIRIGTNTFSTKGIHVAIEGSDFSCKGTLRFGPFYELGKDCMGPFRFLPFMECRHSILSMGHRVSGELQIGRPGRSELDIVFDQESTGYIEMDRGTSFPKAYTWVQCNRFGGKACSVVAMAAVIPYLGTAFQGTICEVYVGGHIHTLATYLGAKVMTNHDNRLVVKQGKQRLEIQVIKDVAHPLKAPNRGVMERMIHESPQCKARFLYMINGRILVDLTSSQASFEKVEP